jgi:hypothetical protein
VSAERDWLTVLACLWELSVERVRNVDALLGWLGGTNASITGYEHDGYEASIWVLHAMYASPSLVGLGTHDDVHRAELAVGAPPLEFNGVSLEVGEMVGTPIEFYGSPGVGWSRLSWRDFLGSAMPPASVVGPPCNGWFDRATTFHAMVCPPGEGTLDHQSLFALISALGVESGDGLDTPCISCFALMATDHFEGPEAWSSPLIEIPSLLKAFGGPYLWTPSNIWSADHSWLVTTDHDLWATKVSGSKALIGLLAEVESLECLPVG